MRVRCKGFFHPKKKKLIKNCIVFWDEKIKNFIVNDVDSEYDMTIDYAVPVFQDLHVHLFLSGTENLKKREHELSLDLNESLKIATDNVKKLRKKGIYRVMDAGDKKLTALTLRNFLEIKNFIINASGRALFKKNRYGSFIGMEISDKKSLKEALKELLKLNVDFIKVLNSGINSIKDYGKESEPQFSFSEMEYITKFAEDNNLEVIVHVNGYKAIKNTIEHNISRLEHAFFIKDKGLIKEIAERHLKIVPTFSAMYNIAGNKNLSKIEKEIIIKTVRNHIDEIKEFINFKGELLLGTDSGSYNVTHGYSYIKEIEFFIEKLNLPFEKVISLCTANELPVIVELKDFSYLSLRKFFKHGTPNNIIELA